MESGKKGRVSDRLVKLDRLHMTSFPLTPGLGGIYIYIQISISCLLSKFQHCVAHVSTALHWGSVLRRGVMSRKSGMIGLLAKHQQSLFKVFFASLAD